MFSLKVAMYHDDCKALRGPPAYLDAVDTDSWLTDSDNRGIARLLERHVRAVRQFVCGTSELAGLLANPFGPRYACHHLRLLSGGVQFHAWLYGLPSHTCSCAVRRASIPASSSD